MSRYEGFVDHFTYGRITGWAYAAERPDDAVDIEVWLDGRVIARTTADGFRADLLAAGKGNGRHAFEIEWPAKAELPWGSRPSVRISGADSLLTGSPCSSPIDEHRLSPSELDDRNLPGFAELSEPLDDGDLPDPDRVSIPDADLSDRQRLWRRQGYLRLDNFLPHDLLDQYAEVRWRLRPSLRSWRCPVPFVHVPEMRDVGLYQPLAAVLDELVGTRMALNLALTGWRSTERAWHQDDYLNPPTINGWYLAAWIALADISEDCGPFEFVPGSHRWPLLRRHKVARYLPEDVRENSRWPELSERFVEPACSAEIKRRGGTIEKFVARKGDFLIWHSRLMHRGGTPTYPNAVRKSLITHYTAFDRQPAWPAPVQHGDAGWYFPIPGHPLDELAAEDRVDGPQP